MKLPVNYDNLHYTERRAVREEYIRVQDGRCYHCTLSLAEAPNMSLPIKWKLFPKGFLDHPIHLHHSHATGMTLGAVHAYCNAVLWQYHGE